MLYSYAWSPLIDDRGPGSPRVSKGSFMMANFPTWSPSRSYSAVNKLVSASMQFLADNSLEFRIIVYAC